MLGPDRPDHLTGAARAVRYLVDAGIRQFLDIGTAILAANNRHEVAQAADPSCSVVYVDNNPIVRAHVHALLTSAAEGRTAYIEADLRDPPVSLARAVQTLDFDRPADQVTFRSYDYVVRLLAGLEIAPPGIVHPPHRWRPRPADLAHRGDLTAWRDVARKP